MNNLADVKGLQVLFENIAEGIALHKLAYDEFGAAINYRIVDCNPQFEAIFGIAKIDVVGKLASEVYQSVQTPFLQECADVAITKCHKSIERYLAPMGKYFSISVTPWEDNGFAAVFKDITRQKDTSLALARHLESINVRVRLLEFVYEHSTQEFLRYALDEICPLLSSTIGFFHFVEPDQEHIQLQVWSSRTMQEFCQAIPTDKHYSISMAGIWTDCIREGKSVIHNDYALVPHKKGLPLGHSPLKRELCIPVFRENKIAAILGVGNKETFYNEADQRLAEYLGDMIYSLFETKRSKENSEEKSRQLERYFTSSLDLLCIADTTGFFRRLNPQWSVVLGYDIHDLEGTSFLQLVHPDDLESTLLAMGRLQKSSEVLTFCNRFKAKSGDYRWIEWKSFPEGELIYAVARDITQMRLAEIERERLIKELQQKNNELERFAYSVSHDLKSPLVTIQGFAIAIAEDIASGDQASVKDSLLHIQAASEKMGRLLQDILQLSRLGRETAGFLPVNLNVVLQEVKELLHGALDQLNIEFEVSPDLPTVMGDALRLRELFQNLCENAIKYRDSERKAIIQVRSSLQDSMHVIEVCDNGIGIDPRHLKVIFDLFRKLNLKTEGTGVGLALVKRIAELHQGRVEAYSKGLGTGAIFSIQLPIMPI